MLARELALLQKRVEEFQIPQWPGQALFERVLIYRIPEETTASDVLADLGDGKKLYKTDGRKNVDIARCPRGVIVSAGLRALDIMRANGMQLGELVWFAPHVPFQFEVKQKGSQTDTFSFMNVGDVIISEDVLGRLVPKDGEAKPELRVQHNTRTNQHILVDVESGLEYTRAEPTHSPDEI